MRSYVYTVTQVNRYVKQLLENDVFLRDVFVEGEISNFKAHSSGHFYFTLKDENAAVDAVMFRTDAQKLKFMPENGMRVTVYGHISMYEKTGKYQLYVSIMEPAGKGALYLAYEKLKEKLDANGYFDKSHKKPIPKYPECIAVVTSPTGAAIRDIIHISGRRNSSVRLVVSPVLVQGEDAPADIVRAIREINEWGGADTIIVGRGGGSIEDLWAFNDESVAMAIYESDIPVISAVGHETDFTIADFVADMRASTPSAAAEIAVPEAVSFGDIVKGLVNRMNLSAAGKLRDNRLALDTLVNKNVFRYPADDIINDEITVSELYKRLDRIVSAYTEKKQMNLCALSEGLERLSPLMIMKKGYCLAYNRDGCIVKSAKDTHSGQKLDIKLYDGDITVTVEE